MSDPRRPVQLVFLWHHHQPDYRSPREGRSLLPWVRLHAAKDYLDMALHLERHPSIRATFNFVPSLLDQLDESTAGPDALFELLARPVGELSEDERREVAWRCVQVPGHARERWPWFAQTCRAVERARSDPRATPIGDQRLLDLEVGFLLAWIDPLFHGEAAVASALSHVRTLSGEDRDALLALHARLAAEVVPAYRRLADRGQVELSASAYNHPILPLLMDPATLRVARPDLPVAPEALPVPEDAREQIARARERHARAFGAPPAGMWPPEGSVSPAAAGLAAACGVRWLATDEGVLWRSLAAGGTPRAPLYQPWSYSTPHGDVALFFRDHELSDRIGFVYHHWNPAEAVADFIARLRRIAGEHEGARPPVVSVILDGENCWENYADDGGPFLEALYTALEGAEDIRTVTPSEVLAAGPHPEPLERLHPGSWIDADFHIWMGHPEKNRAWDLLGRTRRVLVQRASEPSANPAAWEHLFAAEGSDWFWWYGDDHFTADRAVFDRLFREHLQAVFAALGEPSPAWLSVPVIEGDARRAGMAAPIGFVRPEVDGRRTHFYEWHAAGRHRLGAGGASMHRAGGRVRDLWYGFDAESLYLRLDFEPGVRWGEADGIAVDTVAPLAGRLRIGPLAAREPSVRAVGESGGEGEPVPGARAARGEILEVAIPFAALGVTPGERVEMSLQRLESGAAVEAIPAEDLLRFTVPDAAWEDAMWSV